MKCLPNLKITALALIITMIAVELWYTGTILLTVLGFVLTFLVLLIAGLALANASTEEASNYLSFTLISGGVVVGVVLGGAQLAAISVIWVIVAMMMFCQPD